MPRKLPIIYLSQLPYEPQAHVRRDSGDLPIGWGELREALSKLPAGEREVIEARYGFSGPDQSFGAVGLRLGITRQAAQHREKTGLRKLKQLLEVRPD
jgi:DNA-directed RNA polymerase specialized sigma subunit